MLAGIGGIDMVMLVVAADESIKPQTREHFDICRLLAINRGMTVLTKADMVDRRNSGRGAGSRSKTFCADRFSLRASRPSFPSAPPPVPA